jgi:hypothetical protein
MVTASFPEVSPCDKVIWNKKEKIENPEKKKRKESKAAN